MVLGRFRWLKVVPSFSNYVFKILRDRQSGIFNKFHKLRTVKRS